MVRACGSMAGVGLLHIDSIGRRGVDPLEVKSTHSAAPIQNFRTIAFWRKIVR